MGSKSSHFWPDPVPQARPAEPREKSPSRQSKSGWLKAGHVCSRSMEEGVAAKLNEQRGFLKFKFQNSANAIRRGDNWDFWPKGIGVRG